MTDVSGDTATNHLSLPDELILMLLNEQNGYFHQIPGWKLHCAIAGAVLAELSLQSRIDTDTESLILMDRKKTGDPVLDPFLEEIAGESASRNARYWIEHLASKAESVIDLTLDRLVEQKILEHHDGEFWTLAPAHWLTQHHDDAHKATANQFIKARISEVIFSDMIPDVRDVIIVCLVNACDVFRFIYELDEEDEERIRSICRMDLIGRSISEAVEQNIVNPIARSTLSRQIPKVPLRRVLFNRHLRSRLVPALFADLAKEYGPVFTIQPPFSKPLTFVAGPAANRWVHQHGRSYLTARGYFGDFEKVYGATGVLSALDGGDHFRLRRAMASTYSRERLSGQMDLLFQHVRQFMADWKVGDVHPARGLCRQLVNAQLSPLHVGVESQDLLDDLVAYKERALSVRITKTLPGFMLRTPGMKRRAKAVDALFRRVLSVHTPAQRMGCPRTLADDVLGLHASDPQLVPESNLRFALTASALTSVYFGDMVSFALYAMVSQPDLHERIRGEADALFADGDPKGEDFTPSTTNVTRRFIRECLRMYPVIPMSIRDVVNSCVIEGYEIPVGTRLYIAQTASHYMDDVFPDPSTFDIDRYQPPRDEHRSPGWAPYGLGTHTCLGTQQAFLQMTANLMLVTRHFTLALSPPDYDLRFDPFPSMKPSRKLKFHVKEKRHPLPV